MPGLGTMRSALMYSQKCQLRAGYAKVSENLRYGERLLNLGDNSRRWVSSDNGKKELPPSQQSEQVVPESNKAGSKAKAKLHDLLAKIIEDGENVKKVKTNAVECGTVARDGPVNVKETKSPKNVKQRTPERAGGVKLGKRMLSAVKKVAETMGEDVQKIESELVQKLRSHSTAASKARLSDILTGMSVEQKVELIASHVREKQAHDLDGRLGSQQKQRYGYRPNGLRKGYDGNSPGSGMVQTISRDDLFVGPRLGIFRKFSVSSDKLDEEALILPTWDRFQTKNLDSTVTHPSCNGFEEMMLWTLQGKLWKYPIDNEQGMDEEHSSSFEDHIFLEPLIDSWCPKTGPLRTFMQLVCTALSKNAFLTVREKHEYITWYYEYFKEKSPILKEIGLGEVTTAEQD